MGCAEGKSASAAVVIYNMQREKIRIKFGKSVREICENIPNPKKKKKKEKTILANYKHTNYQYRSKVIFLKASKLKCKA
jgi:hypothetical protein